MSIFQLNDAVIGIDYSNSTPTELCDIMAKYYTDKSSHMKHHNYSYIYYDLFNSIRNHKINLFELGLGTKNSNLESNMCCADAKYVPGASLKGWKEFFTNGSIYGADIDKDILFNEENIKTFYCNQTDRNTIKEMWNNEELSNIEFDIIIDDGLHKFYANIIFLEESLYKLKKGGLYIIEDIHNSNDFNSFINNLENINKLDSNLSVKLIEIKGANPYDNNILVIRKN